jgi:VanZ family protein
MARGLLSKWPVWALAFGAWFGLLCWLSSQSQPFKQPDIRNIDKAEHAIYFALGAFLLSRALRFAVPGFSVKTITVIVILTGAAIGWFDEWRQTFTPGRFGLDVYDWVADVTGSVLGALTLRKRHLKAGPSQVGST